MDFSDKKWYIVGGLTIGAIAAVGAIYVLTRQNKPEDAFPLSWKAILAKFDLSKQDLESLLLNMKAQMERGLEMPHTSTGFASSLKMLPSFTTKPKGSEKGTFYALDLGGTNFRVIELELKGGRMIGTPNKHQFTIPPEAMTGTAERLFDFIADSVKSCLPADANVILGFTFSFPINQTAIASGTLIKWTKGFSATGVEGNDVVQLLNDAFQRKGISARVVALANDTVGTMMTRSYVDPKCEMGVILGTGTNACYIEKSDQIKKLPSSVIGDSGMIINMEWGAFGDNIKLLPSNEFDKYLDDNSINPGRQKFEKMISGMYLGEIVRIALTDLLKKEPISDWNSPSLWRSYSFDTSYVSRILNDKSAELEDVKALLEEKFDILKTQLMERQFLQQLCKAVAVRAAKLSATAISAVLSKIGRTRDATVAVDGSVFEHVPGFKQEMEKTIKQLVPGSSVRLVLTTDGSGIGAAIIAASTLSSQPNV